MLLSASVSRQFIKRSYHTVISNRPTSAPLVNGFTGAIGNTPLVRINSLSNQLGRDILAKAEWMNPGGSVKDRAALWIVEDAEQKGLIKAGGTIVEGTAGNTGIGLAHVCKAKGYKCVIFMPNNQSPEKVNLLQILGAKVHTVPVVPFTDPKNYNHQAREYAESIENAVWTNQFDNIANRQSHIDATGPEIWAQTSSHPPLPSSSSPLTAFTCATGTGGTLGGVAKYLKSRDPSIKIVLADPPGSVLYNYVKSGLKELSRKGDGSITEGIGQGRVTENLKEVFEEKLIDDAVHVTDAETIKMIYHLLLHEGIFVGASSALNVCAAVQVAKELPKGSRVVTVLCDGAYRYQSRLFSKSWLESKKLWEHLDEESKNLVPMK
ncbi:cysteine synthase-like protein [Paraphysoderma sedebokerense]|nr:cysteine synthase-like protein [Paraphysoderma sedebokerense]